jgi:hypothetical protein
LWGVAPGAAAVVGAPEKVHTMAVGVSASAGGAGAPPAPPASVPQATRSSVHPPPLAVGAPRAQGAPGVPSHAWNAHTSA